LKKRIVVYITQSGLVTTCKGWPLARLSHIEDYSALGDTEPVVEVPDDEVFSINDQIKELLP
jgi:hypothetical protein